MNPDYKVVGAIFIREGRLFAARRGASRYAYVAHKYEFVGGKVEPDETPEDALRRELREEMALDATVERPYMTVRHEYPDFSITLHTYLCRMQGEYRLLEHEECRWLTRDELRADDWAPADAPIIEALRRDKEVWHK